MLKDASKYWMFRQKIDFFPNKNFTQTLPRHIDSCIEAKGATNRG